MSKIDLFNWDTEGPLGNNLVDSVENNSTTSTKDDKRKQSDETEDVDDDEVFNKSKKDLLVDNDKKEEKESSDDILDQEDDIDFSEEGFNDVLPKKVKGTKIKEDEDGDDDSSDDFQDDSDSSSTGDLFKDLALDLKDKGIFTAVEFKEDEEITPDVLYEKIEEEVESRFEEGIEAFIEELQADEDAAAFIKFKKAGGRTSDFLKTLYEQGAVNADYDVEDPKQAIAFLKEYYKTEEELDEEDIEAKIEWHEENNNIEKFAKKFYNRVKAKKEAAIAEMVQEQERQEQKLKKDREDFISNLKTKIKEVEEIKGIPITEKDKKVLGDFFTKPTVKIGKGTYITQYQKLLNDIHSDPEKLILLGKFVNNDFDISDLAVKAKTEQTRKIKSRLEESKARAKNKNTSYNGKSLADRF